MDSGGGLPKQEHKECVHNADTGEFHGVGMAERRNALKQELPHIGELPFVSFKGYGQESEAYVEDNSQNKGTEEKGQEIIRGSLQEGIFQGAKKHESKPMKAEF
jgi:hypothetical protein